MSKQSPIVRTIFARELSQLENQEQNLKNLKEQDEKLFEQVKNNLVVIELANKLSNNAAQQNNSEFKMTDQHFIAQNIIKEVTSAGKSYVKFDNSQIQKDVDDCKKSKTPIVYSYDDKQVVSSKADNMITQSPVLLKDPLVCAMTAGCKDDLLTQYIKYSNPKPDDKHNAEITGNSLRDVENLYAKFSSQHICKYQFNAMDCQHNDDIIQTMLQTVKDFSNQKGENKLIFKDFDIQAIIALQTQIVKIMCDRISNVFGLVKPVENALKAAQQAENTQQASQPSPKFINQFDMYQFFIKCFSTKSGELQFSVFKAIFDHHAISTIQPVNYNNSPLKQLHKVYIPDIQGIPDTQRHFFCNLLTLGQNCKKMLEQATNYICFCLFTGLNPIFITPDKYSKFEESQYPQQQIMQLLDSENYLLQPAYYNKITSSFLIINPEVMIKSAGDKILCAERKEMAPETQLKYNQVLNTKVLIKVVDKTNLVKLQKLQNVLNIAKSISLQPDTPEQKRKIEKLYKTLGQATESQHMAAFYLYIMKTLFTPEDQKMVIENKNPVQIEGGENTSMQKLILNAKSGGKIPESVSKMLIEMEKNAATDDDKTDKKEQNKNDKVTKETTKFVGPVRFDENYNEINVDTDKEVENTRKMIFDVEWGNAFDQSGTQISEVVLPDGSHVNKQTKSSVLQLYLDYYSAFDNYMTTETKKQEAKIKGQALYLQQVTAEQITTLQDIKPQPDAKYEDSVWMGYADKIYDLRNKRNEKDLKIVQQTILDLIQDIQYLKSSITSQILMEVFNEITQVDLKNSSVFEDVKVSINYWFMKFNRIKILQKINFVPKQQYALLFTSSPINEISGINEQLCDALLCVSLFLNEMVSYKLQHLKSKEMFAALLIEGGMKDIEKKDIVIVQNTGKIEAENGIRGESQPKQVLQNNVVDVKKNEIEQPNEQKPVEVKQAEVKQVPKSNEPTYEEGYKGLDRTLIVMSKDIEEFKKKALSMKDVDYVTIRKPNKEDSMFGIDDLKASYNRYVLSRQLTDAWKRAQDLFKELDRLFGQNTEKVKQYLYDSGAFELNNVFTMINKIYGVTFTGTNIDIQQKIFYSIWCQKLNLWCPMNKLEYTSEEVTSALQNHKDKLSNVKVEPNAKYEVTKFALMDGETCLEKCNIMKKK